MDMKPKTAFALTNSCGWDYMHKTCTKLVHQLFIVGGEGLIWLHPSLRAY